MEYSSSAVYAADPSSNIAPDDGNAYSADALIQESHTYSVGVADPGGSVASIEPRAMGKVLIFLKVSEGVYLLGADDDCIVRVGVGDGVVIAFCGDVNRSEAIMSYINAEARQKGLDDVYSVLKTIETFMDGNPMIKPSLMFIIGNDCQGICRAFRAGDLSGNGHSWELILEQCAVLGPDQYRAQLKLLRELEKDSLWRELEHPGCDPNIFLNPIYSALFGDHCYGDLRVWLIKSTPRISQSIPSILEYSAPTSSGGRHALDITIHCKES